ncbi:MAG: S-layer homology domain-containing protein, partial [Bacillota bacterium]
AEIVAKMLENVNGGAVDPEDGDVLTLKKLATEFRSELVDVVNENEELKEKLSDLADQQEVNQEDLVNANDKINKLRQQVDQILKSITEEAIRTNKLQKKLDQLETENNNLEQQVDQLSSTVQDKTTEEKVDKLERRFVWLTGGLIVSTLLIASK